MCLIWGVSPLPHIEFWGLSVNNDLHYPDTVLTWPGGGQSLLSPWHGQGWQLLSLGLIITTPSNNSHHYLPRTHAHETDPCTVSWLWGMAGPGWAALSPQAIWCHSHPMCPRPPLLTNFTVTDWQCPMSSSAPPCARTYGHSAWILHNISLAPLRKHLWPLLAPWQHYPHYCTPHGTCICPLL